MASRVHGLDSSLNSGLSVPSDVTNIWASVPGNDFQVCGVDATISEVEVLSDCVVSLAMTSLLEVASVKLLQRMSSEMDSGQQIVERFGW